MLDNDIQFRYLFVLVSCEFIFGHILGISYLKDRRSSISRADEKNMAMTMVSESVLLTAVDRVERRQESRWINSRMGLNQEWNRTHPILFLRYPQFNNIRRYPRQRTTHRGGKGVQISPVDPLSHTLIKMGVTTGLI